jgi:hypothetical protein
MLSCLVKYHIHLEWRWNKVGWDPNAEDRDVDGSNDDYGSPLDPPYCITVLRNQCNSVDDDLHQKLDLEGPAEEDEEQDRNTTQCQYQRP